MLLAQLKRQGAPLIYFAISRAGFESYRALGAIDSPLWVCAGVLADDELDAMRAGGVNVSDFNYTLDPNDWIGIEGALGTIREHHPGHTVWVGV